MAGGGGNRLRPITATRPKPFVPVGGRPVVEYVLDALGAAGIRDIILTTSYRPQDLLEHLGGGDERGQTLFYSVEDRPRGTAGGVKRVGGLLGNEAFLVASGDVFADLDLAGLIAHHRKSGALATMGLARVDDPTPHGIVDVAADGRVAGFVEKPSRADALTDLASAGFYVLEPEVLDLVPSDRSFDFAGDLFPLLLERGESLHACEMAGGWIDIGRPADLVRATSLVAERAGGAIVDPSAHVPHDVVLDRSAIHARATLGNAVIARRSIVLEDASVDRGAILDGSIVGAGARIGRGARLTGCFLGDGAIVAPGAVLNDLKLDVAQSVPFL